MTVTENALVPALGTQRRGLAPILWEDADVPQPPYILSSDGSVREGQTVHAGELPALHDLEGIDLTFVRIDHQARLQFGKTEIVIETPFELTVEGAVRLLNPGQRANLGPLLALYPATLTAASVDPDLTLRLSFDGAAAIAVPQHPHYESWHIVGPDSRLIVCPPAGNGTLSVWR